jgi:hypothetical protein
LVFLGFSGILGKFYLYLGCIGSKRLAWKMVHVQKLSYLVTFGLLATMLVSSVCAQGGDATLIAISTLDANVITLRGSGFSASSTVSLSVFLNDGMTLVAVLPDAVSDSAGNFEVNVTAPIVQTSGIYLFGANTSSVFGFQPWVFYALNDLPTGGGSTGPKAVSVSPDNSNVFNVTGRGLGASRDVKISLNQSRGVPVYTFTDTIKTDSQGRFSTILIVPTSISGTFTLVASTSAGDASVVITVPNLKGATGLTGATGATGETGEKGATGDMGKTGAAADSMLGYIAVILSAVAIVLSLMVLLKKR